MFRISFTVRDGSLSSVHKELDGKAYDLEVRPVATKAKTTRGAGDWLGSLPDKFRFRDARQVIGASVSTYLSRAIANKKIKRAGTGQYVKI